MSSPALLELIDATVVKGGVAVLNGLTLTIRAGEHTAILGPNGAGKTTLVNLLTHQDYAFASEHTPPVVRVFGRERWDVFELRSQLGIISNDLHQRFVSGHSAGRIRGLDAVVSGFFATQGFLINREVSDAMREEARHELSRLEALHLADKPMDEMSTGEARRVLIARALVCRPKALILDEPTSGLDVVAKHRFLDVVRRIAVEGTTIVLITHHVDEIFPEIKRVMLLGAGRIVASGPKAQMLTSASLSPIFGAPISIDERDGYYYARA